MNRLCAPKDKVGMIKEELKVSILLAQLEDIYDARKVILITSFFAVCVAIIITLLLRYLTGAIVSLTIFAFFLGLLVVAWDQYQKYRGLKYWGLGLRELTS